MTRRVMRRLAIGGGMLLTLGLAILGAYGLVQSEAGRAWIARTAAAALSTPGETEVSFDRLEGRLPQGIRLLGLSVRDRAGPWLNATAVEIDWRPLELFSGKLHVTALHVADLEVARPPETAESQANDGQLGFPSLPFRVTIEQFSVEDVTLGTSVLGQPASFRIAGKAASGDADKLTSSLVVERTDGTFGRAEARAVYAPRDDRLTLDVAVNEPAGGLIARALDLPELPAVAANLSGDGTLDDWRGDTTVSFDDLGSLAAELALSRRDGIQFRIAGSALSTRSAEQIPWRLLAGDLEFEVRGQWNRDRVLTVERAHLDGPAIRLDTQGHLAFPDLTVNAHATVRIKDPVVAESLVPGGTADGIDLEAKVSGPVLQPKITAAVSIQRLTAPGVDAQQVTGRFTFVPERPLNQGAAKGTVTANGEVEDLTGEALTSLEPLLGRRFAWRVAGILDLDNALLDASEVFVQAGANEVSGTGAFGLADGTVEADVRISLGDLAGLSPLVGMTVQGRGDLAMQATVTDFGEKLTAKLAGELIEVKLADDIANALFGGRATVATDLAFRPDAGLTLAGLRVETPASRLVGEAALTGNFERIEASYGLTVADTSVLSDPFGFRIAGRVDLQGRLEGYAGNPSIKGRLAMTNGRIKDAAIERIDLTFSAENLPNTPNGHVTLSAAPSIGQLEASADFVFADPELQLTDLRVHSQGATAEGTLTAPINGTPLKGSLNIKAESLAPWLALAGLQGSGAATAKLDLSGNGRRQTADFKGNLTEMIWRPEGEQALRAESVAVTLRATDLMDTLAGRAAVEAEKVTFGELQLDRLSLSGEGNRADVVLHLQTAGAFRDPLVLDAIGSLHIDRNLLSLELETAQGRALGNTLKLREPVKLTQRPGAFDLSRLDLDFGPARISGSARIDSKRVSGELTVDGLPIASLASLSPAGGATGTVTGSIKVDGPLANPSGEGRLDASNLKIAAADGVPPLGLDVSGQWRDRRLKITGRLTGMPERDAMLDAELPLRLDADRLAFTVPDGEPISARLSWQGDMASVWSLVPLASHRMAGASEITAVLAGSLAAPEVSGSLRLTAGEYENLEIGTLIRDIEIALDVEDNRATLTRFTGNDGAKGRLSATAEVAIASEQGYPFKFETNMTEFALVRRDDVTAVSDGHLSFEGALERASLTGQFETRSVEVRIIDRLPAEVTSLNVIETDTSGKTEIFRDDVKKNGAGPEIMLDVAVAMPRRVFVRGRGLDSEWSGDLKVTGTAQEPIIEGDLSIVRGQLSVLTKTFRLKSGSVRFPGDTNATPELDILAEHRAKDLTVTARVSGPATNPSISLASVPELPQDEIVSRILFNRSAAQLGAIEAAQLAAAAAELTGAGGGLGPLDFARSLLGVDVLRIETAGPGEAGGPGVTAGKYLREDIYVGVKKGVTDNAGAVGVEIELTPNISVESETGTTGESDIGIKFKWDY